MAIGIFINSLPRFGGVFQYSLTLVSALAEGNQSQNDLVVFSGIKSKELEDLCRRKHQTYVYLGPMRLGREVLRSPSLHFVRMIIEFLLTKALGRKSSNALHQTYHELVRRHIHRKFNIALMIYPRVDFETFHNEIPFIFAIHDIQHRINPQFPEVSAGDLWEWREYFFRNACRNALGIFVDSQVGKEDVINCYDTPAEKIVILPFLPPDYLDEEVSDALLEETRSKFHLPKKFLFYPAQFWPHKNHCRIVSALGRIKHEHNLAIPIVFCGGKFEEHGEFDRVMYLAKELQIENQIHYLGYIDSRYLAPLYKLATGLVMPTFFGPTNIPILEAWKMGCPVITSDIRGCRDQAGDAAILVDPADEKEIAKGMLKLYRDEVLRKKLIRKGKQRLVEWNVEGFKTTVRETVARSLNELNTKGKKPFDVLPISEMLRLKAELLKPIPLPKSAPSFAEIHVKKLYPRISVITPSFNAEKYIEEAIESVLMQKYPNFEHIIVDGGSTDGTIEIVKKYPHLRWISKKDRGQPHAMNNGFRLSTGDIITYLNADDFYEPGVFFDAVQHLNKDKGIYFVVGECTVAKPDRSVYVPAFLPKVKFFEMMHWWQAWFPINPSAYFYYREVQDAVGLIDESDHYMQDYDFLLRVSMKYKIHAVERVWGNFRWIETSKTYTRPQTLTRQSVARKYYSKLSYAERITLFRNYFGYKLTTSNDDAPDPFLIRLAKKLFARQPAHA